MADIENEIPDINYKKPEIIPSGAEAEIFKALEKNNTEDMKEILESNPKLDVNFVDDHRMTPLQHAAYKGNVDIVNMLLKRGADVNKCEHEFDYTALHFGALSGNSDVCLSLLNAGCKTTVLNSVGRTAAQMAGFVSNYSVVSTINNYVNRDDVAYFAQPQPLQPEPILAADLVDRVQKFVLIFNLHPIRVAIELQSNGLIDHVATVHKVLQLMTEREMKSKEPSDILAFKFYYLAYMANEINKILKTRTEGKEEEKNYIELYARKLLKVNKDGVLEYMDKYLRECVREFPYRDSALFVQIVTTLANPDCPPAMSIIHSAVNGVRATLTDVPKCSSCGEERPSKKCSKCKIIVYCDRECQRLHWFVHKKSCSRLGLGLSDHERSPEPAEIQDEIQKALASK